MLLHFILIIILVSIVLAWMSLAPWVPTKNKDLKRINQIADLQPGQKFFEMGCGNGRVCSYIAQQNPEVEVVGIELAFLFYLYARLRAHFWGPKNLKIIFGNALKYDIADVDVIYVFGLTDTVNKQIKQKIVREMKLGAKLVSYCFSMKEWEGISTTHKDHDKEFPIHVYSV